MRRCTAIAAGAVLLAILPSIASADLLQDYFGVSLTLQQSSTEDPYRTGQYAYYFSNSWVPTPTNADYVVGDWQGTWDPGDFDTCDAGISGGEPYDVEAIYFDDDPTNLYIAIVTSFPEPPGLLEQRATPQLLIVTGDLALDLGLGPAYDDDFRYNFGININGETRPDEAWQNATSSSTSEGSDLYRTYNSDWYVGTPDYAVEPNTDNRRAGELTNFDPGWASFSGSYRGDAVVDYYQYTWAGGLQENFADTWVIEATISRADLPNLVPGDTVGVQSVMGCRNDGDVNVGILRLEGDIDTPEPGTLALIGVGLVALYCRRRASFRRGERDG
jgi:hypothetical protein